MVPYVKIMQRLVIHLDLLQLFRKLTDFRLPSAGTVRWAQTQPMAVLDAELRVRGVKGLRVADTSVMPLLNQAHSDASLCYW